MKFYYPTSPLNLWDVLDVPVAEQEARTDLHGWWKNLDIVSPYNELDMALLYLTDYIAQEGPFDGVVGFSQGAAIAFMLASLCESTPARAAALAAQAAPVSCSAPQKPFTFAIAVSGFRGSLPYYDGFYEPKIATPSLHVVANWDTVLDERGPAMLVSACEGARVVRHPGAHVFPSCGSALRRMLDFVHQHVTPTPQRSFVDAKVPGSEVSWTDLQAHRTDGLHNNAARVLDLRPSIGGRMWSTSSTSSTDSMTSTSSLSSSTGSMTSISSSSTDRSHESRRSWRTQRNYTGRRVIISVW